MSRSFALLVAAILAGCAFPVASPVASEGPIASSSASPTASSAPPAPPASSAAPTDPASGPIGSSLHGHIAYVAGDDPQIFLLDLATGASSPLTDLRPEDAELEAANPWRPMISCFHGPSGLAWSPDGGLLAFGYGGCEPVLHVVDLEGNRRRIDDGGSPTWSPDGRLVAFRPAIPYAPCGRGCLTAPFPGAYDLHLVDIAGGGLPRPLTVDGATFAGGQPLFSGDGARIVHTGPVPDELADPEVFSAVYVTATDGSTSALIRAGAWPLTWLADGRLVLIDERTRDAVAIDLDSGDETPILPGRSIASISPDGRLAIEEATDPVSGANLARLRTLAGNLVAEVPGAFGAWAPDGRHVAFVDDRLTRVIVLRSDGGVAATWPVDGPIFPPLAWRPGS